ncbi:MAG: HmuY family protein [Cellvibrio sp.]|uniref:HmuY family protein n=1 Tax=Cellvibrio sp. TaxID=1965322 RepID=UPI0031AFE095
MFEKQLKLTAVVAGCLAMVACGGGGGGSSKPASSSSSVASSAAVSSAVSSSAPSSVSSSSIEASSSSAPASSSSSSATPIPLTNVELGTGSAAAPAFAYYDLDTSTKLTLTEAEAATNKEWDIAFRRDKIYLNAKATTPVKAYATGNNADFFDASKAPIAEKFINATSDSELPDFNAVVAASIPAATSFTTDKDEKAIGGKFYSYNMTTHVVTADPTKAFIVFSDGNYSKVRAKALTSAGRTMSSITLGVSFQDVARGDTTFMAEVDVTVDAVACTGDLYVDLDTQKTVTANDNWDITIPCVTVGADTGASFELNLASDATAIADATPSYTGIDKTAHNFMGFQPNVSSVLFFGTYPWYQYNVNPSLPHYLYSQFQVYLIKTATATYKFQIVTYYAGAGASGTYGFRYQSL